MAGTHTLMLSGVVTIIAGDGQTLVTLNENQLRSLAHSATQAVAALDDVKKELKRAGVTG